MDKAATSSPAKRLKLPPYGRELLAAREGGQSPKQIIIVYGATCWRERPKGESSVCVDESYEPYTYDWSIVAGVPTRVHWLSGEHIYDLVAEVAKVTAPVSVMAPRHDWCSASHFLHECVGKWRSALWNDEADRDYREREAEFDSALLNDLYAQGRI